MRIGVLLVVALVACNSSPTLRGTTIVQSTDDRIGPYPVLTQVDDSDGLDRVTLHYKPGAAGVAVLPMREIQRGVYRAAIPGQPPFTLVRYFVQVDDGDQSFTDPADARSSEEAWRAFWVRGTTCRLDLECGPGESCDASGVCRGKSGPCTVDADCGKGRRCGPLKTCLLAVRACRLDEGCLLGEVCDQLLRQCAPRPTCRDGRACPLGFVCDAVAALGYPCWRACLGPADCGPGETCLGSGRCSAAMTCLSGTCPAGLLCDPVLKLCRPEGAGLCAACQRDADCGGPNDHCLLLASGQFCGRSCVTSACPVAYVCNQDVAPAQCQPASGNCSK